MASSCLEVVLVFIDVAVAALISSTISSQSWFLNQVERILVYFLSKLLCHNTALSWFFIFMKSDKYFSCCNHSTVSSGLGH